MLNKLLTEYKIVPLNCINYIRRVIIGIETAYKVISASTNGEHKAKLIEDVFWTDNSSKHLYILANEHYIHENTAQLWVKQFLDLVIQYTGI